MTLTPAARPLPAALPSDRLTGLLNRLPDPRTRLSAALAAVHALGSHAQRHLLTEHLDPTRGRLTIRRPGWLDHTVYLDETLLHLTQSWLAERHRRWPTGTNPHLLVTAHTVFDPAHPPVSTDTLNKPLRRLRLSLGRLGTDRILDEARHSADPLNLVRLFDISPGTAMRYINTAHPAGPPQAAR